ncbi:MAG: transcription antitermination factor [Candidatus Parcubacteria bacterium]|jgi:transcriptional antiterminator NusG
MAKQHPISTEKNWYVIHSVSGLEDNVAQNLKKRIESLSMEDYIFDVIVPKEKKIKVKNGKRVTVEERIYPGYVFVEMIVTDNSWYVVRNTPNVTGFIGAGTTPIPVSPDEMNFITKKTTKEDPKYTLNVDVDDLVKIIDGPFKDFEGKVSEVDESRGKLKVLVNMFGRNTPVELDSLQIKKV